MKKLFTLLFLCLFGAYTIHAQTTIYSQTFEPSGSAPEWSLSTGDLGGTLASAGSNIWIINNVYAGGILGTPTPNEPAGIVGYPNSYYMHINCGPGLAAFYGSNDNFNAAGSGETYFAALNTPISTVGYTNVYFSFWWVCLGDAADNGLVYYKTSAAGPWILISAPTGTFYGNNFWSVDSFHNVNFDGQPYLVFGFQFTDGDILGSDPAFGIDDITVTGDPGLSPVASFSTSAVTACPGGCITATSTSTGTVDSVAWSVSPAGATIGTRTATPTSICFTAAGTYTVSIIAYNTVGSSTYASTITVNPLPTAGTITGTPTVCTSATTTLADAATGGIWSASNTKATVVGGVVTGVTAGTDSIFYSVTNSCGTADTFIVVTINPSPVAGTISGSSIVCVGSNTTLTDLAGGGVWSASNGNASVLGGVVTGITAGTDSILYSVSNSCGTATAYLIESIVTAVVAGTITGTDSVCSGSTTTLTDAITGGTWSASNSNATVAGGVVSGVAVGMDSIWYTVSSACGSADTFVVVTINPSITIAVITGTYTLCPGGVTTLSDLTPGGVWSAGNTDGTITPGGVVTGITAGTDVISYVAANACGSVVATYPVTIFPDPYAGIITGPSGVCIGYPATLTDVAPGGVWSASNAFATVLPSGVLHGFTVGLDTISYTVTNVCGTAIATDVISVDLFPVSGTITGSSTSVCVANDIIFSDSTAGGVWSTSNSNAVATAGIVAGISPGIDSVIYTVANACGTSMSYVLITVNTLPNPGTVSGPTTVCVGESITMSETVTGGLWNVSNSNATITGDVVTGLIPGLDTIWFLATNSCGVSSATYPFTVIGGCATGISAVQGLDNDITISPNPTQNAITISASNAIGNVVISNLLGQTVFAGEFNNKEAVINMEQLPIGMYIVRVNESHVYKVVKE